MTAPSISLNSGTSIPQVGLGVWQATNAQTEQAVRYALDEAGYRHIDTASIYGNEEGVGKAIRASSVPREQIFVTTKLWNSDQGYERALTAFDKSLARLGTDYVDLFLIHWPLQDETRLLKTWDALEKILSSGKAKAIGVSNFEPRHMKLLLQRKGEVPSVNQVELHPRLPQAEIRKFGKDHGVAIQSWSPLGGSQSGWGKSSKPNTLLGDPVIARIAERHGKSPAQVLVRWHVQNGLIVIPKSVREARIKENIAVFDFELSESDLSEIATLENDGRLGIHPDQMNIGAPPASAS